MPQGIQALPKPTKLYHFRVFLARHTKSIPGPKKAQFQFLCPVFFIQEHQNHIPGYAESRPDLVAPVYGGTFPGTLPEDAAPLFVVAPEIAQRPGLTGIGLYTAWQQAGLPAELHYFADCEHGFGYKSDGAPVNDWITLLYHFMQKTGFVPSNESK